MIDDSQNAAVSVSCFAAKEDNLPEVKHVGDVVRLVGLLRVSFWSGFSVSARDVANNHFAKHETRGALGGFYREAFHATVVPRDGTIAQRLVMPPSSGLDVPWVTVHPRTHKPLCLPLSFHTARLFFFCADRSRYETSRVSTQLVSGENQRRHTTDILDRQRQFLANINTKQ